MQSERLVLTGVGQVELQTYQVGEPGAGQVLYRTLVTLISPGTESARFTGLQPTPYPMALGNAAVGEVLAVGPEVTDVVAGDRIFTYGQHARFALSNLLYAKLPSGLAPERAVFVRLAGVGIAALRVADITLGETAAVIGLGPVGNFAAQLYQLAGATVWGLDLSARRRALGTACGLRQVLDPGPDGGLAAVKTATGGHGVKVTVEAVGNPRLVPLACQMTAPRGEVVLAGSPRGEWQTDATELLNLVHLWGNGCITLKGAHEWRLPARPADGVRHSLLGDLRLLLELVAGDRLLVAPLHTDTVQPSDAAAVYQRLSDKDAAVGVLFDWR
ncbi:MAG: zinc-binding alcohol dehydrogenase [Fimbriimonadaceae bacterium]|nr:zinc-binding alcohol dehydrogenase [Fimbriimonadaceae bacterium]